MKKMLKKVLASILAIMLALPMTFVTATASPNQALKDLKLWYDEEAPYGNENVSSNVNGGDLTDGWEKWSLPIGNGYMGVNVFGRTVTERLQITENTLTSNYSTGGLNNFSETYIDFNHPNPTNYIRDLNLRTAIAGVNYDFEGTTYNREIFTSYPDKVMVIRLTANQSGKVSFTLRPTIPFIKDYGVNPGDGAGKSACSVVAEGDTITLKGIFNYYNMPFEGQYKVIPTGGTMTTGERDGNGTITVAGADSATIIVAVGTSYILEPKTFLEPNRLKKLEGNPHPHEKVSKMIADASKKSYDELKASHLEDYTGLFGRVELDLGGVAGTKTTDLLLKDYQSGALSRYLEELYFQYGRYLLIASSRKGSLPPNLQGVWNRYDNSPWGSGYWHNINIQMNYWPTFSTNLSELFDSYVDFYDAYAPLVATQSANEIRNKHPKNYDPAGNNGWSIATGIFPYSTYVPGGTGTDGYGTGALMAKSFTEYYNFTMDKELLENRLYDAIVGSASFMSRVMEPYGDYLLANPSASPEQFHNGSLYVTVGSGWDQQNGYEINKDAIKLAQILGREDDPLIKYLAERVEKFDPVVIGYSGQVKEFREENFYGDLAEYRHRHISHLVGLYPGTLINDTTPAWIDAARKTLTERGDQSTGWAMAHRLNLWARAKDGERAFTLYKTLLQKGTLTNLWDTHPPFQIDGNFGGTSGVAEMLLQSQAGYIEPLPAIPATWATGSYSGLLARGNFDISAKWTNNQVDKFEIISNKGGECIVKYDNLASADVKTSDGATVAAVGEGKDFLKFNTVEGETYVITNIPPTKKITAPTNLSYVYNEAANTMDFRWTASPDAVSYNLYCAYGSAPDYELISSGITATSFAGYSPGEIKPSEQRTYRVTAIGANGRESLGTITMLIPTAQPEKAQASFVDESTMQVSFSPVVGAAGYNIYKKVNGSFEKILTTKDTILFIPAQKGDEFAVSAFIQRESLLTPIEIVEILKLDNILLGKPITANRSVYDSYPLSNALDGNLSSRYAVSDIAGPYYVEIDLQGSYYLDQLTIHEFSPSETDTRSKETTIEVLKNGQWITVIDKKSLTPKPTSVTKFNMDNSEATKIRITFNNPGGTTSASIYEIICSATVKGLTNKFELSSLCSKVENDGFGKYYFNAAQTALINALAAGNAVLKDMGASPEAVEKAVTDLKAALADPGLTQNLFYDRPIRASVSAIGSTYAITNMVDGKLNTRFAGPDNGKVTEVEIDLAELSTISKLYINEYMDGGTRSGETTVEVYNGAQWITVLDKVSLKNGPNSATVGVVNEFNLNNAVGSKVKFTFVNTIPNSTKRITIWEIAAEGGKYVAPIDKTKLAEIYAKAEPYANAYYPSTAATAFYNALKTAKDILANAEATQAGVDKAVSDLKAAMETSGLKLNVLFKKPITANVGSYGTTYGIEKMVDGDTTTRYAGPDTGKDVVVEINMEKLYSLGKLSIREYLEPAEGTRGGKTSVEVFNGFEWVKALEDVTLNNTPAWDCETVFNLNGIVGSKIKLSFYNTHATNNKRITIREIAAEGSELDAMPLKAAPQIITEGYAANVSITLPEQCDGAELFLITGEAEVGHGVISGKTGILSIDKAPAAGEYNIVAKLNDQIIARGVITVAPASNIWTPEISSEGDLIITFAAPISLKPGAMLTINGTKVAIKAVTDTTITADINVADINDGNVIRITGVKYPSLFPGYSFVFTLTK